MAKLTQDELLHIFNVLKKEMMPYEKAPIVANMNIEGRYDLRSNKKGIIAAGKPRPEMGFVAIIIQSNYVGFYFTPIYTNKEDLTDRLDPDFLKLLKGMACFHVTKTDPTIIKHVKAAMKMGYEVYKKNGWV